MRQQQVVVERKLRADGGVVGVPPGEPVIWESTGLLGTSPRYDFRTTPKFGYPWKLTQLYVPFSIGIEVPLGTAPVPDTYPITIVLIKNEEIVWTITQNLDLILLSTAGFDDYVLTSTIAQDFSNPIPYGNPDNLRFDVVMNNLMGVPATFLYVIGGTFIFDGVGITFGPQVNSTLSYQIEGT